jgi:hypothetical protein
MFFEIDPDLIKKSDDEPYRRWFRDSEAACDLIIWEDKNHVIERFQFWHEDALIEWKSGEGLKTGVVDQTSGAFTHYQTRLYRIHHHFDDKALSLVHDLLKHKSIDENDTLLQIKQILFEIATRH